MKDVYQLRVRTRSGVTTVEDAARGEDLIVLPVLGEEVEKDLHELLDTPFGGTSAADAEDEADVRTPEFRGSRRLRAILQGSGDLERESSSRPAAWFARQDHRGIPLDVDHDCDPHDEVPSSRRSARAPGCCRCQAAEPVVFLDAAARRSRSVCGAERSRLAGVDRPRSVRGPRPRSGLTERR